MNVLKADFISKQKRLQDRRQKVTKTFFSGYHTVSSIFPSADRFKLPISNEKNVISQVKATPRFPIKGFFNTEESVPANTFDTYLSETITYENEIVDRNHQMLDVKDATASTSSEFQKLLEPFLSIRQGNTAEKSELSLRNTGEVMPDLKVTEEEFSESDFCNQRDILVGEHDPRQKTPRATPQCSLNFTKETFDQYNIFDLPVPRNQKSIEEVLSARNTAHCKSSQVCHTPVNKIRNTFSDLKTPKTRLRKSPKVSSSSKTVSSDSGTYILAITEGRGHARGEVGIAAMDPKRPHLVLCQISDSQRYVHSLTKMNVFDFMEVIVPNTFVDCALPNKLYSDIRSTFPKVTLTSVQRRHFSESIGIDLIRQYCSLESTSVMVLLQDKFYALSAAAALIKYIEFTQNVRLAPRSLKIEYQGMEDTMILDLNTANLLELVLCINHPETNLNHSLLGVIKYCHTKGGVRLLRANILQPSCSLAKIETRLDCVTELVNSPLLLYSLEAAVSSFSNLEDLLNLCMHAPQQDGIRVAEYQLKYTLLLKTMLELLPKLRTSLTEAKSQFFHEVRENLEDSRYLIILNRILQTVFENAKTVKGSVAAHLHGCFAIKAGINSLLDIAKRTYCEIIQEISDHVTKLRDKYNMSLRLAFSANKGFHIQYTLPPGQRNLGESFLPKEFILAKKSKTTFSFYTTELVALDQRSQHVLNEIKLMTNVILFDLLTDIRQYIGCLFNLCEYIAELDVLISFAHVSSGTNYVRPKFGDELNLKESRHPILDVVYDGEVVPNDVFATADKNFTILTGPNQSGKSIYIRQIALLQIMAQIGCYVPAKEATFRLTDRIFSRISFEDSIENNASTLIVEMRDVEFLKQNKTSRSLVIIDELCRGTSVDEGTSLAFAICEELLDSSAFVFFTTHYLLLTKLEEMYFNVTNYHFESKVEITPGGKPSIQFTHLRKPGVSKADSYGLQVAELTSFPRDVCIKAKEISLTLSKDRKPSTAVSRLLAKYELSLQLRTELVKLGSEMNWQKMESVIQHFRQLYADLTKEETLAKTVGKRSSSKSSDSLEDACRQVGEKLAVSPRLVNFRALKGAPGFRSFKGPGFYSASTALINKKSVKSKGAKDNTDIILRLAKTIVKKYEKLKFKKNRIQEIRKEKFQKAPTLKSLKISSPPEAS